RVSLRFPFHSPLFRNAFLPGYLWAASGSNCPQTRFIFLLSPAPSFRPVVVVAQRPAFDTPPLTTRQLAHQPADVADAPLAAVGNLPSNLDPEVSLRL